MRRFALSIDFGGTNTKMGLVDRRGKMHAQSSFPTRENYRPQAFAQRLGLEAKRLLQSARVTKSQIAGVGIGVPGLVDPMRGVIHKLVNVPGWNSVRAGGLFQRQLGLSVHLENDVNAMALGESLYGAARGYKNVVCITLGTGVGGGLILEGQLYRGASLTAGEIGHIVIESQGPRCNCGTRGCLEALIGTKGLVSKARLLLKHRRGGVLHRWLAQGKVLTPHLLARAAGRSDPIALAVWRQAAGYLGRVLAGVFNLLDPDIIVIGGGVAGVGEFFLNRVRQATRRLAMHVPGKHFRIVRSRLGNNAGVVGAASLVWKSVR